MFKQLILGSSLLITSICSAQWTTLNSTTSNKLNDVDFIDHYYGVIVGDTHTVLLTSDGGENWNSIAGTIIGNVTNVDVINYDTIIVSTLDDQNANGTVYLTENGGATWTTIYSETSLIHGIDLEHNIPTSLFAAGAYLVSTEPNFGSSWDTLVSNISGTTSLSILKFANNSVGHLSGQISGFFGYSAWFYRTENNGESWFAGDPFSFPNSDGLTTMCFIDPDTALVFTNNYAGFMPSNENGLVKIYNFNKVENSPGDTSFVFTSAVVNTLTPGYMNDATFESPSTGYAICEDGKVYKTVDGGITWTTDFSSGETLFRISSVSGIMYAVGNNGKLIKYGSTLSVDNNFQKLPTVYPNPFTNQLSIPLKNQINCIQLFDVTGKKIISEFVDSSQVLFKMDTQDLPEGLYLLNITTKNGESFTQKIVK